MQIPCKVCERGEMHSKKVFRMGGPVVVIGFIFLIPSILGMMASLLVLFGIFSSSTLGSTRIKTGVALDMRDAGISEAIITNVLAGNTDEVNSQIADQERIIMTAREKVRSNQEIQVDAGERM